MTANWSRASDRGSRDRLVQLAKEDLAEREGLNPDSDEITIKSVEPVTWIDMTLGYPHPGRKVAPGFVPGYQIILNVSGRDFDYHSGFGRVVYVPPGKGQPALPANIIEGKQPTL